MFKTDLENKVRAAAANQQEARLMVSLVTARLGEPMESYVRSVKKAVDAVYVREMVRKQYVYFLLTALQCSDRTNDNTKCGAGSCCCRCCCR